MWTPHMHPDHAPGHELTQRRVAAADDRVCDYCDEALKGQAWSCGPCGYDLCQTCHDSPHAELWERLMQHNTDPPDGMSTEECKDEQNRLQKAIDTSEGEEKLWARLDKLTDESCVYDRTEDLNEWRLLRKAFTELRDGDETHPDVLEVRGLANGDRDESDQTVEEYRSIVTAYDKRPEDLSEESVLAKLRLGRALADLALSRKEKNDRPMLREAETLVDETISKLQDMYGPEDSEFYRVIEAHAIHARICARLYMKRRAERDTLQKLVVVLAAVDLPTGPAVLDMKGTLSEVWDAAGYDEQSEAMEEWLKRVDSARVTGPEMTEEESTATQVDEPVTKKQCTRPRQVMLPFCDGNYRCTLCTELDGPGGGGFTRSTQLVAHYTDKHSGVQPPRGVKGQFAGHISGCECGGRVDRLPENGGPCIYCGCK